nr:hypothetical protein GCM10020092_088010 [Actinoplanes digitatis]
MLDIDAPPKPAAQPETAQPEAGERQNRRPRGGTVAIDDPAVQARCLGELPLGERIRVRLTEADPITRSVLFERV